MRIHALPVLLAIAVTILLPIHLASQNADHQEERAGRIKSLAGQLRWHDEVGKEQYKNQQRDLTAKAFSEIDSYIVSDFRPEVDTADQIHKRLDAVLGTKDSDFSMNVVYLAELSQGKFLIAGIELSRGGGAIGENAISFRAYREVGDVYQYIDSTEDLVGLEDGPSGPALSGLNAASIPDPPIKGEFWFVAWADVPPRAPFTIAARIFAFDGRKFRTVWTATEFIASRIDQAIEMGTDSKLTINKMPDWQSQYILHEKFVVTADGPRKVDEWKSERE
jgi:hypothetical protein